LTSFEWRPIRYRNVISILKNPFYAGVYAYGKSEKVPLAIERLMIGVFFNQDHRQQARPGKSARDHMEGRRRLRDRQDRHLNFSRTCSVTNHWRGITSSVSVTSSPIFESLVPPQQGHDVGAG
jgi:hypothetical protein